LSLSFLEFQEFQEPRAREIFEEASSSTKLERATLALPPIQNHSSFNSYLPLQILQASFHQISLEFHGTTLPSSISQIVSSIFDFVCNMQYVQYIFSASVVLSTINKMIFFSQCFAQCLLFLCT